MRQLSQLCIDLDGINHWDQHRLLLLRISQLRMEHQEEIHQRFKDQCRKYGVPAGNNQSAAALIKMHSETTNSAMKYFHDRNVLMLGVLRQFCQYQQQQHVTHAYDPNGRIIPEVSVNLPHIICASVR